MIESFYQSALGIKKIALHAGKRDPSHGNQMKLDVFASMYYTTDTLI